MIVLLNRRTARTVLSAAVLTLGAIVFGFPVSAMQNVTNRQWCMSRCQLGNHQCFVDCDLMFPKKKASMSPAPKPTTGTGAPVESTHLHR